jgi:hypothetical protein
MFFSSVLERIAQLQREQAPQADAVLGRRDLGLVEHLDGDGVALVDQRREADQRGAALAHLEQLGSSPKVQAV